MKSPTFAPVYACLFPALSEIAQACGYALAIHGSLQRDLDLIAVPWVDDAAPADALTKALVDRVEALHTMQEVFGPHKHAHGRFVWTLVMRNGAFIDLAVMPRQTGGAR